MSLIREQKRKSSVSIGQAVFYPNSLPPPLRRPSKALPPYTSRPTTPTSPVAMYNPSTIATPPRQSSTSTTVLDRFSNISEYPFPSQDSLPHLSPTRKLTHLFDGLSFATPRSSNHDTYSRLLYSAGSEPDLDITTPNALPLSDLIDEAYIEEDDSHTQTQTSPAAKLYSSPAYIPSQDGFNFPQPPPGATLPNHSAFKLGSPPKQSFSPQSRLNVGKQPSWSERQNLDIRVNQTSYEPPSPLSGHGVSPLSTPSPMTNVNSSHRMEYLFPSESQFHDVFSSGYQSNAPRHVQVNNQLFTPPYTEATLPATTNSLQLHHPHLYPSAPVSRCSTPSVIPQPIIELPQSEVAAHYLRGKSLCPSFARRYIIRDELGSGGFGFVCSALQTGYKNVAGIEVAVKFILKDRVQECDYAMLEGEPVESFVLSRVQHPSIIGFREFFEDEEFFYLVQELHGDPWEPGHTLEAADPLSNPIPTATPAAPIPTINTPQTPGSAFLFSPVHSVDWSKLNPMSGENGKRPNMARRASYDLFECVEHQRFSEDQARMIFRQIVDAVGYLHRRGIYHRDLKDENIVIDRNLCVKIIDFGSAVIEDPTLPPVLYDHFRGTMSYASAEVLNGRHYLAGPADIWSLGIILGIILTGESPFPNTTWAMEGRIKIKRQIPGGAFDLMQRCLHTDPRKRARIGEVERHPWLRGMLAHRGSIC
ncbi:uncharacterized protein IL334_004071 [Kwoniella shivajii]|uniref:Protein kinase domain-containing protein n=1 Tax=Kwoniella shivajii TaxID=564305 RepID=A0ABZ1CZB1_9TREE|nr:hypothetical protein IL334_004071 [Kwoniella shivajii]